MVKFKEKDISGIFHALADATRREIIKMVAQKERQATELARSFHMSFPAVSKHLKVLENAGFIRRRIDGRVHRFYFEQRTMKKAYQWIKFYEKFWLQNLDNLNEFLKEQNRERKK